MDSLRIFVGVDPRQPVAYHVLCDSIMWRASKPVAITPLRLDTLPIVRKGLTEFSFSRYLVPYLCGYEGVGLFMDADILVTGDIAELFDYADPAHSVQVMKKQPRFEWSSVMLFNADKCKKLTPKFIDDTRNSLSDMAWADSVGELPEEWSNCVGYSPANDYAKLYHHTMGLPVWPETRGNHREDAMWIAQFKHANSTVPWKDLMGNSVHADATMKKFQLRQMGVDSANN